MDALLGTLGVLFALFLILAAAVEAVLELLRGALERVGITWLKGKTSLDDALKLAADVSPSNEYLATKLAAIQTAASQVKKVIEAKQSDIAAVKQSIAAATSPAAVDSASALLNNLASTVKEELEGDERRRIWVLKGIAVIIGILFAWKAEFHVFQILAASPEAATLAKGLAGLQADWLNILVGGIASAAGSNYWHDQLDRVRAVKSSFTSIRKITAGGA